MQQPSKTVLNNKRSKLKIREIKGKLAMGCIREYCKYSYNPNSYFQKKQQNFENSSIPYGKCTTVSSGNPLIKSENTQGKYSYCTGFLNDCCCSGYKHSLWPGSL